MQFVRAHWNYITDVSAKADEAVDSMVSVYEGEISLPRTIPGLDRKSAVAVISEIGIDMEEFDPSKRLCCRAELTPGTNEFAGKKKSV